MKYVFHTSNGCTCPRILSLIDASKEHKNFANDPDYNELISDFLVQDDIAGYLLNFTVKRPDNTVIMNLVNTQSNISTLRQL